MIDFPSGEWVGFFTYHEVNGRFMMDLRLEFKGGIVSGDGADGIGEFRIAGSYTESEGECEWTKTYLGRHSVVYRGFREGKGIWGTWALSNTSGGFHIWPLSQGGLALERTEEETLVVPGPFMPVGKPR